MKDREHRWIHAPATGQNAPSAIPATLSEADARARLAALGFSDDAIDGFFRDPRQAATAFANYVERRHDRQKAAAAILHALVAGQANTPKREARPHHTTEGPAHHRAALVLEAYCWDELAAELREEVAQLRTERDNFASVIDPVAHAAHDLGRALQQSESTPPPKSACTNPNCESGAVQVDECELCNGPIWQPCPTCKGDDPC